MLKVSITSILATSLLLLSSSVVHAAPTSTEPRSTSSPLARANTAIWDVTPTTTKLNAKQRHTQFFSVNFTAQANADYFVATELVVNDAKKTSPNELFLGVTLSCKSPSGRVTSAEGGRNVWPASSDFTIPVAFTFSADVAGTHNCQADVMMCNPGNCNSPTGKGIIRVTSQKKNPKAYSFLYISPALPNWAESQRVPNKNTLVLPQKTFPIQWGFDASGAGSNPIRVGGLFSVTNCIVKNYPTTCKSAKVSPKGSASVSLTLTLSQTPSTPGTKCAQARATSATGAGATTITWQQHHAVLSIYVPDFTLSSAPGCSSTVEASVVISAGKGNAIVVEPGTEAKTSSLLYAIPGDSVP